MTLTKSITKWWWGWNPEKIEDWLEQMDAEGWHLYDATSIGIRFHFMKGESRRVRYCADYQSKIGPEYKAIFQDAGWELVYSGTGWYIWRMEYVGERPDIYTDIDSMIDRNKRLITLLGVITVIEGFVISTLGTTTNNQNDTSFITAAFAAIFGFIGYSIYNLLAYNKRLNTKRKL